MPMSTHSMRKLVRIVEVLAQRLGVRFAARCRVVLPGMVRCRRGIESKILYIYHQLLDSTRISIKVTERTYFPLL